jgi:hypothetical protein
LKCACGETLRDSEERARVVEIVSSRCGICARQATLFPLGSQQTRAAPIEFVRADVVGVRVSVAVAECAWGGGVENDGLAESRGVYEVTLTGLSKSDLAHVALRLAGWRPDAVRKHEIKG